MLDKDFIVLANKMADDAGTIALRYFGSKLAVDNKADASPVTIADREIETSLRSMLEKQFPDHGIIGEEFGNVRKNSAYQWILDPIDGTKAFIAGQPTFTTLIALAEDGIPLLGVISQPVSRERWLGIAGEKTTKNGTPQNTSNCTALAQATIATTAMKYFKPEQAIIFDKLRNKCANLRSTGDAYLYAKLASGEIDIVVEANLKPYDFCALKPVIEGAGGIITDWNGKHITINSDGRVIAAASKKLHEAALALLK